MSRIGKTPISIPQNVKVVLQGQHITLEGPNGVISWDIPPLLSATVEGGKLTLSAREMSRKVNTLHGLTRTLVSNMVKGVVQSFFKELIISGVGYRAEVKDRNLVLALGYSHPITFPIPDGIHATVEKGTKITISGADKELVGRVAAKIRGFRIPDPYKEKGIKYSGEIIQRKVGKAASAIQTGKGP